MGENYSLRIWGQEKIMTHKDLYRHCKPDLVNRILEDFLMNSVLSGSSFSEEYEKKIDQNIAAPIKKWNGYLSDLGFTCINKYEQVYSFWYISFDNPGSITSHATINVVLDDDFQNRKISHIMTCIYQGRDRKVLVGNIDELYEKVSERLSIYLDINTIIKDEDESVSILKSFGYDRRKCMTHLVSLAKKGKIKWDSIASILQDDMKKEHRSKINGEKFNL